MDGAVIDPVLIIRVLLISLKKLRSVQVRIPMNTQVTIGVVTIIRKIVNTMGTAASHHPISKTSTEVTMSRGMEVVLNQGWRVQVVESVARNGRYYVGRPVWIRIGGCFSKLLN